MKNFNHVLLISTAILILNVSYVNSWSFGFGGFNDYEEDYSRGRRCPYEVLGVSRDSTHKEIRKAFLKLSKQYHPDINKEDYASDKFKEINDAYEILSNNDKREAYDSHGYAGVERLSRGGMDSDGFDMDDIFTSFFGTEFHERRDEFKKAEPLVYPVTLSLDTLFTGQELTIKLRIPRLCKNYDDCKVKRNDCQGFELRVVTQQRGPGMYVRQQIRDHTCIGKNLGWKENCKACPNGPLYMEDVTVTVNIEPGTRNQQKVLMEGRGQEKPGLKRGDIIFIINEEKHHLFSREGDDLFCVLDINLKDSLLGFTKEIDIFGKDAIVITQSGITPHNNVIRLNGKGMPVQGYNRRGDLHVTINVIYPKKLTNKQIDLLRMALE